MLKYVYNYLDFPVKYEDDNHVEDQVEDQDEFVVKLILFNI